MTIVSVTVLRSKTGRFGAEQNVDLSQVDQHSSLSFAFPSSQISPAVTLWFPSPQEAKVQSSSQVAVSPPLPTPSPSQSSLV